MTNKQAFGIDLLVFGTHPDDVEILCSGLVLKTVQSGHSVGVVDLTRGERGTRGSADLRDKETEAASKILGLKYRRNLKWPDGEVGWPKHFDNQLHSLIKVLRELKPEVVLIPHKKQRHPDHVGASELLSKALFLSGAKNFSPDTLNEAHTVRQILFYQERYPLRPTFLVDISDVRDKKVAAIRCYSSQLHQASPSPNEAQPTPTLLASPLTLQMFEARDRYLGAMIGVDYAEAYICENVLPLKDPVQHFRENLTAPPLVLGAPNFPE